MKVTFRTNLDHYKRDCFPTNLDTPPRVGEFVAVTISFANYYSQKKLPLRLEVVSVTWTEKGAVCELWYNETDAKIAKEAKAQLF